MKSLFKMIVTETTKNESNNFQELLIQFKSAKIISNLHFGDNMKTDKYNNNINYKSKPCLKCKITSTSVYDSFPDTYNLD